MAVTTKPWDITEHLDSEEAIAAYLDAVFADGDPGLIKAAIADVARARGMTEIAAKAGISRVGLYKALSESGNPSFATIAAVMKALGVRLSVAAQAVKSRRDGTIASAKHLPEIGRLRSTGRTPNGAARRKQTA